MSSDNLNDSPMTPVERVLMTFVLDTAQAFSQHGEARATLTALEEDVQASLHRALKKLDTVMVVSAETRKGFSLGNEVEA